MPAAVALRGRSAGVRAAAAAAGAWLLVNLPVVLAAPTGWLRFLELSRTREPTNESLWRLLPDVLGADPSVATMNTGSALLTTAGTAVVMWVATRRDDPRQWHLASLPLIAVFLLASKVYSPQFSLWLLPFLALAMPPVWTLVAFAVADVAVSVTVFPYIGGALGLENPWSVGPLNVAVAVRAALLVLVAVWGWRRAVTNERMIRAQ